MTEKEALNWLGMMAEDGGHCRDKFVDDREAYIKRVAVLEAALEDSRVRETLLEEGY